MSDFKPVDVNADVIKFIANRRSPAAKIGFEDGPTRDDIEEIIHASARVPDHRALGPWRFVVIDREKGRAFGQHLAARYAELNSNATDDMLNEEAGRLAHAPWTVTVISSPVECVRGTPAWEQELSAGALCYNMLLISRAKGFACQWLTKWFAYDEVILGKLGVKPGEKLAGFMHIGKSDMDIPARRRPDVAERIEWM